MCACGPRRAVCPQKGQRWLRSVSVKGDLLLWCLSSHCLLPDGHWLKACNRVLLYLGKNTLYFLPLSWDFYPRGPTVETPQIDTSLNNPLIRERELRSQTNRNLDRNTHFLWRMRSKHDNNTCSSSLTPQVNSTSLLDILNTAHFNGVPADNIPSYSFFSSSSHLLCYPLPIPLRAPLSSPGRDTKGPVRQSNQELPWMAGAYISPIHPLDISRQNSSRRYDWGGSAGKLEAKPLALKIKCHAVGNPVAKTESSHVWLWKVLRLRSAEKVDMGFCLVFVKLVLHNINQISHGIYIIDGQFSIWVPI